MNVNELLRSADGDLYMPPWPPAAAPAGCPNPIPLVVSMGRIIVRDEIDDVIGNAHGLSTIWGPSGPCNWNIAVQTPFGDGFAFVLESSQTFEIGVLWRVQISIRRVDDKGEPLVPGRNTIMRYQTDSYVTDTHPQFGITYRNSEIVSTNNMQIINRGDLILHGE